MHALSASAALPAHCRLAPGLAPRGRATQLACSAPARAGFGGRECVNPRGRTTRAAQLQLAPRCRQVPRPLVACASAAQSPSSLQLVATAFTNAFPVWVALGACVGLAAPSAVTWFQGSSITAALAVTMLGMGLTMEAADMVEAVQSPKQVAIGVALQFSVMPLLAFAISRILPLPTPLAVGLILVGCCPGGTASNLVTYIARANVALSVVLTAASTLLASVATPALCALLAGTLVPVPAGKLMVSTAQVVLAPVALGLVLKRVAPAAVASVAPLCPPVAVATVTLICASVIGGSAAAVRSAGPLLLLAVFLLHAGGFLLGYLGAAGAGYNEQTRRTVSIEVGMQNSALGCVLALAHFSDPTTAVPAAISATAHSVIGSALAGAWRAQDAKRASLS